MPVINGVYTKDFPALGRAPIDTDIIPIAEVANQITYKTTIGEIFNAKVFGTAGAIPKFTSSNTLGDSIITELSDKIGIDIATPNNKLSINSTDPGSGLDLQIGATSYARFGIINPGIPGEPGIDNDCFIGSTINNDFLVRTNNIEALRIDTAQRLTIANIQNALADTDKFLVSEGGVVKYRTGAEVLADIGGASATGFVPYTGATSDVDLGLFDITASSLIKAGGVNTQFLKADGSVDNNNYLTANDLPSTLSLYATNVAASVSGYFKLVTAIDDPDYNTIAVDIPTGAITTTEQLIASLVSPVNLINGNPGVFNVTTTGNITRLTGSGEAEFFFKIYKRDSGGVETLIGTSGNTIPVINSGYSEFFATAIWNDGIFDVTDSIVLKYYANRIAGGSNPTYQFQFGGDQPVRTIVPVPLAVIPNIYLEDLADVEDGTASNNDGIFFDSSVSLWKYKSVSEVLGYTPVSGTGTTNYIPKFNGTSSLTNSTIYEDAGGVAIGVPFTEAGFLFYVNGGIKANGNSTINGNLTASQFIVPGGTSSQFLKANGSLDSNTYATTSSLSAYVPYTGATGAVNLGAYDLTVNGINIGLGGGAISTNTRVGNGALNANTIGSFNTSIGRISLNANSTGGSNTAIGDFALGSNTTGGLNIAQGAGAGNSNTTGSNNIFLGYNSTGESATESNRTWIGNTSTTSTWLGGNLLLGSRTNATSDKLQITGGAKITGIITLGTGADSYVYDSGGSLILQTGASARLTINSAGNTTLSGTLNGTSATFSTNLTALGGGIDTTLGDVIYFGNATYPNAQKNRIRSSTSATNTGNLLVFETGNGTIGSYNTNQLVLKGDGNVGIGNTGESVSKLYITGSDSTSSNYALMIRNTSGNELFFVRNDKAIFAPGIYDFTTGSGANVVVFSDGSMQRSTSSLKYKKNIENYTKGLKEVMQMRPVTYNSKNENETQTFAGLIAEEIHDLGLTEFVQYATDGSPDALSYSNMVSLLVKSIQEQQAQIEELKALINK